MRVFIALASKLHMRQGFARGRAGYGVCHGRRPGRPALQRMISANFEVEYFKPVGVPMQSLEVVFLKHEELEAVRLVDLQDLTQEEAALEMGVSRKTLWRELQSGRKKIADALVNGKAIQLADKSRLDKLEE